MVMTVCNPSAPTERQKRPSPPSPRASQFGIHSGKQQGDPAQEEKRFPNIFSDLYKCTGKQKGKRKRERGRGRGEEGRDGVGRDKEEEKEGRIIQEHIYDSRIEL